MYIAVVSTRRVSDVTEALFGASVSSSAMSELNKKMYDRLGEWRMRPLDKDVRVPGRDGDEPEVTRGCESLQRAGGCRSK